MRLKGLVSGDKVFYKCLPLFIYMIQFESNINQGSKSSLEMQESAEYWLLLKVKKIITSIVLQLEMVLDCVPCVLHFVV